MSGSRDRGKIKLDSSHNLFLENDISELVIKDPDEYSDDNNNGYAFTGTQE